MTMRNIALIVFTLVICLLLGLVIGFAVGEYLGYEKGRLSISDELAKLQIEYYGGMTWKVVGADKEYFKIERLDNDCFVNIKGYKIDIEKYNSEHFNSIYNRPYWIITPTDVDENDKGTILYGKIHLPNENGEDSVVDKLIEDGVIVKD